MQGHTYQLVGVYDTGDKEGFIWCADLSETIKISHFRPKREGRTKKKESFYHHYVKEDLQPASLPSAATWKELNNRRHDSGPLLKLGENPQKFFPQDKKKM